MRNSLLTTYFSRLTSADSGIAGLVPSYSGGTTRDLHPLPCIRSVNMLEVTIGSRPPYCQLRTINHKERIFHIDTNHLNGHC